MNEIISFRVNLSKRLAKGKQLMIFFTIKHRAVPTPSVILRRRWLYLVKTFLDQVEIGRYLPDLLGWHNIYPKTISSKSLRPDIVLLSMANLKIIVVELSIPYESRMDQSNEYKTRKYEDLKKELEKEGYSVIMKTVEIGARGLVEGTLYQFQSQIRIKGRNRSKRIKRLREITENSSMWIWKKRKEVP